MRPELDAAIHEAVGSFYLVLKPEIKVPEFLPRRQKFIVRLPSLNLASHDGAVLDPPAGICVAFPARQGLPVKD